MFHCSLKTPITEKCLLTLTANVPLSDREDLLFPCSVSLRKNAEPTSEENNRGASWDMWTLSGTVYCTAWIFIKRGKQKETSKENVYM